MNQIKEIIQAIEKKLCQEAGLKSLSNNPGAQRYLNTKLPVAGIPVPIQRKVAKEGFSLPCDIFTFSEVFREAEYHEVKTQAILYIDIQLKRSVDLEIWKEIKKWTAYIDNWAHSDGLSSFYSKLLERHESHILPVLKKWNTSRFSWERRQSIVSLMYYQRSKKRFPPVSVMMEMIEALLDDKEYYVQKGVGWALRELWQLDMNATNKFLKRNAAIITPTAFTAAVEKLSYEEKEVLKRMRKESRVKEAKKK